MEDIQSQFKKLIQSILNLLPSDKDKITQTLRNPIQLKILKQTVSVGFIVIGLIFIMCYMAGVSRTNSLNPFHAFAFRYYPFYLIGLGITYLAYRISYYFLNDVADGDKLTPNGEKGNSEWMIQDVETFEGYKLVIASKKNSDWNGDTREWSERETTSAAPFVASSLNKERLQQIKSNQMSKMKYLDYLKKESESEVNETTTSVNE